MIKGEPMGVTNWELATDSDLVGEVTRGSEQAFEELIKRHDYWIRSRCHRALGNWDLAEEASQEIFLKLYLNAPHYSPSQGQFSAWLGVITFNHCAHAVEALRRLQRKHPDVEVSVVMPQVAHDDPLKTLRLQELGDRVRCALKFIKGINPQVAGALEVVFYSDMVGEAAAKYVGVSKQAFRIRVARGYEMLREILADYEDLAGPCKEEPEENEDRDVTPV